MLKRYLILQSDNDQALTVAKLLKQHKLDCYLVGGYYSGKKPPFFYRSSYFDAYQEVAHSASFYNQFDSVIPTAATSTEDYVSLHKTIQLGELRFDDTAFVVSDKVQLFSVLDEIGVPYPKTYLSKDAVKDFPVFYKNRHENVAHKIRGIARSKEDIAYLSDEELLFQAYIAGDATFGVAFIAENGNLLHHTCHEEVLSYPKTGGSGVVFKAIENERLVELTKEVLKVVNYTGWGLAEFKYCEKRKDFVFMEVNPKLWASIAFTFGVAPIFAKKLFGIALKPMYKIGDTVVFKHRLNAMKSSEVDAYRSIIEKAKVINLSAKRSFYFCLKRYLK